MRLNLVAIFLDDQEKDVGVKDRIHDWHDSRMRRCCSYWA